MRPPVRQALLLLIAAWAPLCCCQLRAAVAAITPSAVPADVVSCCAPARPAACCREADGTMDAEDGCREGHPEAPPADHRCCSSCKERVTTPPPPALDLDPVLEIDAVATMLLAASKGSVACPPAEDRIAHDTGPPPRPSGRAALARHSVLVI